MTTKTIRHTFHSIGDQGSDVARAIGSGTSHMARRFGSGSADVARRFGSGTADVARRIGPWRALIGLAVIGAAVGGGVLLARYVRARRAEQAANEGGMPSEKNATSHHRTHAGSRADHVATH